MVVTQPAVTPTVVFRDWPVVVTDSNGQQVCVFNVPSPFNFLHSHNIKYAALLSSLSCNMLGMQHNSSTEFCGYCHSLFSPVEKCTLLYIIRRLEHSWSTDQET